MFYYFSNTDAAENAQYLFTHKFMELKSWELTGSSARNESGVKATTRLSEKQ